MTNIDKNKLIEVMLQGSSEHMFGEGHWKRGFSESCQEIKREEMESILKAICKELPEILCTQYSEGAREEVTEVYNQLKAIGK
jgi:hypothetical protein